MGRQKKARRFEPRYGVSAAALEVEAEGLRREVDDYSIFAPNEIDTKRVEHHANCEHSWKHICLIIDAMPERDQRIVQALLFRDLWLVLELYKTYLQPVYRVLPPATKSPKAVSTTAHAFSEWLFAPPAKE